MHENILWLRQLGLQVPSQADVETSLARPGPSVRRPAAASRAPPAPNARQPLYPKHVCDIEFFSIHGRRRGDPEAAKGEDGEYPPPPRTDGGRRPHARPRVRDRRVGPAGGLRPRHGHLEPPPWTSTRPSTRRASTRPAARWNTMVERVVPDGGFEYERHPLVVNLSKKMPAAYCPMPPAVEILPRTLLCPAHPYLAGARRGVLIAVAALKSRRTGGLHVPSDGSGEPARAWSLAWDMIVADPCNGFQPG